MKESILFCSVGRRTKLLQDFKNTLNGEYNLVATDNSNIAPALYVADKSYIVPEIYSICKHTNMRSITTSPINYKLALSLFVLWVLTDNSDSTLSLNDFAFFTNWFN